MSKARAASGLPNHIQLTEFIASILPVHPGDVPFAYHSPRGRSYDPVGATVSHVILSVTPTPGVYSRIHEISRDSRRRPLCFLHRPFGLDRKALPSGTLVLASHKRFDEILTVGFNQPLAAELGIDNEQHVVLKGYKGDPTRLMGILGPLRTKQDLASARDAIQSQFGVCELFDQGRGGNLPLKAIAIANAFNPEMVERTAMASVSAGWTFDVSDLSQVLYLTGQARGNGVEAARLVGMPFACVGHRAAEEWGIRHLASQLRSAFPGIQVTEIFEDEKPLPAKPKSRRESPRPATGSITTAV